MTFLAKIISPLKRAFSRLKASSLGDPASLGLLSSLAAILAALSRVKRPERLRGSAEERSTIRRFDLSMRLAHWLILLGFLLLTYSGVAMMWPPVAFGYLNVVFWLHRLGALLFTAGPLYIFLFHSKRLLAYFAQFVSWTIKDALWLVLFPVYLLLPRKIKLPRTHLKLNPGQRVIGSGLVVGGALLILSGGIRFLEGVVPYELVSRARLVHRLTVPVFLAFAAGHIYLGLGLHAAFVGVARTMLGDGRITRELARMHWPGWYEQVRQGKNRPGVPPAVGLRGALFLLGTACVVVSFFAGVSGAGGERTVVELPHGSFEAEVGGERIEVRLVPSPTRSEVSVHYRKVDEEAEDPGGAIPAHARKEALIRGLLGEVRSLDHPQPGERISPSR